MAKKKKFSYKNLVVNEEELSITKIGEMPNANKSPIFLFLVFGLLFAFVFFLPDVVSYFGEEDGTITGNPIIDNPTGDAEEPVENEPTYYDISANLVVNLEEGINVNNFQVNNNSLFLTIVNNKTTKFYFSKRNYFIELYSEDKMLLERIIMTKESIASGISKDFSYSVRPEIVSNATKIVFVEKEVEDYPNVSLTQNEAGEEILTCVKDYETITYKFKESKLLTITDVVNYTRSTNELDYQTNLTLWQNRAASYNNIEGMSSSFISNDTGFIVNTVLDLANVKKSSIDNENYYEYETLAKVVSFEMQARGFSCS